MSSKWANPYYKNKEHAGKVGNVTKMAISDENFRKVQRRREENAIMRGLSNNCGLSVDELKDQFAQQEQSRSASVDEKALMLAHEKAAAENQEKPPPVQCVGRFDDQVRCLETTHGGATIWTGHDDGSLGIRNGVTGECVYLIEPAQPEESKDSSQAEEGEEGDSKKEKNGNDEEVSPPTVDVLYNAETHMWVGFSDGTIRIYDTLVYVLAFESKMHDAAVTSFATTFDGKVFSASQDGTIIKWDSESGNFEVLAHIRSDSSGASVAVDAENANATGEGSASSIALCMTTYGYNGFAGCSNNTILQFDTETCAILHTYEGHEGHINDVCVAEGFLISAGEDGRVFIWSIDTGSVFHELDYHTSPVKSIFSDTVAQRVWSTDASGVVNIWEMSPSRFFPVVSSFVTEEEASIHRIKGVVAVDAVKIWSLGSDGRNKVWHSATNKIEMQTGIAVDAMSSIIAEDAIELAKWNELIRTMEAVAERMKKSMSTTLCTTTTRQHQREFLYLWLQWLRKRYLYKKQVMNAKKLEQMTEQNLRRQCYDRLFQNWQIRKDRKRREILANSLNAAAQRDRSYDTYQKMRNFYYFVRARQSRKQLAEAMQDRTDRIIRRNAFEKVQKYRIWSKEQKKKRQLSAALACTTDGNRLREFYAKWLRAVQFLKNNRGSQSQAKSLCIRIEHSILSRYMQTWAKFAHGTRGARARGKACLMMVQRNDYCILSSYYNRWEQFALAKRQRRNEIEYEENKAKVNELLEQLKRVQHLTKRRRLIDDAQAAIDAALADRERRKARIAEIHAECDETEVKISHKREDAMREHEKSVAEQVADLIAQLKVKCLNFHHDFALIHKTKERIKMDKGGVIKIFLEGHIAVKKVVVEITKQPYLDVEKEWPIKDEQLKKLKSHYCDPILNGIKIMVIAFDAMTPQDRTKMTTDAEIVLNASWLIKMADQCVAMKVKKLGKGTAFRVKK